MQEEVAPFAGEAQPGKTPDWLTALALLAPAGWLVAFGSVLLHARLVAGEWPHGRSGNYFEGTMSPGSGETGLLNLHMNLVVVSTIFLMWIVPLGLLFLGAGVFAKRLRQPHWLVATFLVSSTLAAVTVFFDPGGFMNWLAD